MTDLVDHQIQNSGFAEVPPGILAGISARFEDWRRDRRDAKCRDVYLARRRRNGMSFTGLSLERSIVLASVGFRG